MTQLAPATIEILNILLGSISLALAVLIFFLALCHRKLKQEMDRARNHIIQTEKSALIFRMVAGITHDINSRIGVILSAFTYLRDQNRELRKAFVEDHLTKSSLEQHLQTEAESAEIVEVNLNRIADLVKSFKRLSVDQANEGIETFHIREYLDQILISMNPRIRKTSVTVRVNCDRQIQLTAWPGAFSQILTNLIDNALNHAFTEDSEGMLEISVVPLGLELELRVSDNGTGMSEDIRSRIFDPFFTTRSTAGGTGLGLYVVSVLVRDSLKGTIRCESRPGQGTEFILRFPAGTKLPEASP